jgi:8-oxo-dGTP diphosphatase
LNKHSVDTRVILVNRCFVFNPEGKLLILKRAESCSNNPGKWEIPGGRMDVTKNLDRELKREVYEETGLDIEPIEQCQYAVTHFITDGKYQGFPYIALFHSANNIGGDVILSEEHFAYEWVYHEELLTFDMTPQVFKAATWLREFFSHKTTT